ncbi:MAG: polysaccharide biosynthesis tyrosine autokinase [Ferruginibacter sp.]
MSTRKPPMAAPAHNGLQKLAKRFKPYWLLFTVFIVIGLLAAFVYKLIIPPLYEASARVMIQDNKKGAEISKQVEALDVLQSKKIIDNETDVIVSKPLLLEVISKLRLYAPVYKKNGLKKQLLYTTAPVTIECSDPSLLVNQENIPFSYNASANAVVINDINYTLNQWHGTPYGRLRFLKNPGYFPSEANPAFSFSIFNPSTLAHNLGKELQAKATTKSSSIIELSVKDEDPIRAETIIQSLVDTYINSGLRDKNKLADNTLAFLEERIKVVEKELHDIEQRRQQYMAANDAFDISTKGKLFLQNVSENDRKMGEINTNLAVLDQLDAYVADKNAGITTVPSTIGVTDPQLIQLLDKLYSTETKFQTLKKTAGENNPIVLPLKEEIEKIKPDLRSLLANQRRNLQASRNHISTLNDSYASLLNTLPKTERDMVDIDREQNIKSNVYSFLLQKKEETALSKHSVLPEGKLVSTDVSDEPVSPNMLLIFLLAITLSVLAGMGFVVIKESFGENVMFRDQIELATNLPVIGEISVGTSADPIVITENSKTFIAEQFRRLRMSLSYPLANGEVKRILVTSAISGEGKSFIASNLALALAISGKKVALLDFDLNNPSLDNKLNLSRNKGITDYLLNECNLDEIVYRTDLNPSLYLLSTGRLPHNPTELLMSERTETLLKELDKSFDYLVIDTAPVIPVTDAYILSKYCDLTLYVIRHKYTPKIFLERMDEENKMHSLKNVGIIFNSVSSRGIGNSNYGYGYGYGYTYEDNKTGKRKRNSLT